MEEYKGKNIQRDIRRKIHRDTYTKKDTKRYIYEEK